MNYKNMDNFYKLKDYIDKLNAENFLYIEIHKNNPTLLYYDGKV